MANTEKIRILPLDGKSDYGLWKIRVIASIEAKGYANAIHPNLARACADERRRHASNIILNTLNNQALCVVRNVDNDPLEMLSKLDKRYDSKTVALQIAKMFELVGTRYTTLRKDTSAFVDAMAALIEQLRNVGTRFDDKLAVGMLVASLDVRKAAPFFASINTL